LQKKKASEEKHNLNAEFVGSKGRMELEAYRNIREQLAEYIRDKMFEEYTAFAGTKAGIQKVQPLDKRLCGKRIPIRMDGISETKKIKGGCGIKQRKELMETIGSFFIYLIIYIIIFLSTLRNGTYRDFKKLYVITV
jgi:hypothetical protein